MTTRRTLTIVTALIVLSAASAAEAQEIMLEGPLAGAPACSDCTLYRQGRFSIAPMFNFTLLDDYRRHIFIGGRAMYNITEWLGVGLAGGAGGFWGSALDTGLTEEVSQKAPTGIESNRANYPFSANSEGSAAAQSQTSNLLGRILGYVSLELHFVPFRGKLGLFSRLFLDVDLYIFAGYALPFVRERGNVDCRSSEWIQEGGHQGGRLTTPDGQTLSEDDWDSTMDDRCPWNTIPQGDTRVAVGAGTYGVGVSIYANDWISVFFEYRLMPFLWNHTGTDERGMALVEGDLTFCPSDAGEGQDDYCGETGEFPDHRINESDRIWTLNHMFSLGVVFHFPLTPRRSE